MSTGEDGGVEMQGMEINAAGDSADSAAAYQPANSQVGIKDRQTSSPRAPDIAVSRTDSEKERLRARLTEFYQEWNPNMLDDLDRIVNSNTPEDKLFAMLHAKYCRDEDEDDEEAAHPQLVAEGQKRPQVYKKREIKKRGGDTRARRYSDWTLALLWPVSVTMIIVVWAVTNFTPIYKHADMQPAYLAYNENEHQGASGAEKFGGALLNALIIVGFFVVITFLMVLLYKLNCTKVIYAWLIFSSASILYLMGWIWFDLFCTKYQIPYDMVTVLIIMWNFGTVGVRAIYFRGHPKVTQGYLVATSAIMAWFLTRFPEWTTWVLLGAIACYDLYAVLTPKGPLKALVDESAKRDEPLPGLIYESKSYKLGLGDFVFYSVLVGRASMYDFLAWEICFITVLCGLCGTLCLLGFMSAVAAQEKKEAQALPALPISIFGGIAMYFLTRYLVLPYAIRLTATGNLW